MLRNQTKGSSENVTTGAVCVLRSPENLAALTASLAARAAATPGGKLVDPDFPPAPQTAGAEPIYQKAAWIRASCPELLASLPAEATQGKVGDCWFLSAADLVARSELVGRLLAAEHPEAGFYIFSFYKEGNWVLVFVDDSLPWLNGRPLFASLASGCFFQLLEKAYAKLRGSYGFLSMGSLSYAFTDLTGDPCSTEDVSSWTWDAIRRALDQQWLITASPYYPQMATGREVGSTGLYANHAYSLIRIAQVDQNKLLELRNPWGHLEWKGAWTDRDARWTPAISRQLDHHVADDGDFWIDLADFQKFFTKLVICRLYDALPRAPAAAWQSAKIRGRWQGQSAGGSRAGWASNPRYSLALPQNPPSSPVSFFVSLSQEDVEWRDRAARTPRRDYFPIGISVCGESSVFAQTPTFVNARDVSLEFEYTSPCFVVPATFDPGEESQFILCVYCPVAFRITPKT